jgi:hypothetical protein
MVFHAHSVLRISGAGNMERVQLPLPDSGQGGFVKVMATRLNDMKIQMAPGIVDGQR